MVFCLAGKPELQSSGGCRDRASARISETSNLEYDVERPEKYSRFRALVDTGSSVEHVALVSNDIGDEGSCAGLQEPLQVIYTWRAGNSENTARIGQVLRSLLPALAIFPDSPASSCVTTSYRRIVALWGSVGMPVHFGDGSKPATRSVEA